ncbi:DUF4352 domain-containing protein [Sphaerisporangium sp. TRM90804]|uniref:DUF4352 domain-containing protein n=1 Tax=Sphaerisporangium sp. TRM90804 TaxID=3031113 RepID=UPI00244B53BF|nr:DUF4352 domain-containing protein [Sphaerisporangium sp. TRM90804]MDH2429375.1 DUF4352 domain-containing protein [Sphaerisporangium sp. TRM90804]
MAYQQGPGRPAHHGPPPGYGHRPAPPPPKKSHTRLILVVAGVLAVVLAGGAAVLLGAVGIGSSPGSFGQPADASGRSPARTAQAGAAARDGRFEFRVTKAESVRRVGDRTRGKTARGRFVLVYVEVRNVGDRHQYFAGSYQRLRDAQGRRYEADTPAANHLGDADSIYERIEPGDRISAVVPFDTPRDVTRFVLELHDSPTSEGVGVPVTVTSAPAHEVTFEATGEGVGEVRNLNHKRGRDGEDLADVPLPWRKTVRLEGGPVPELSLSVLKGSRSGTVTCRIKLDGRTVAERAVSGDDVICDVAFTPPAH